MCESLYLNNKNSNQIQRILIFSLNFFEGLNLFTEVGNSLLFFCRICFDFVVFRHQFFYFQLFLLILFQILIEPLFGQGCELFQFVFMSRHLFFLAMYFFFQAAVQFFEWHHLLWNLLFLPCQLFIILIQIFYCFLQYIDLLQFSIDPLF